MPAVPPPPRSSLRSRLLARRRALDAKQRMTAAQGLRRSLEQLPEFLVDTRIAGYWAHDGEIPLNLAIAAFAARGQQLYLPTIGSTPALRFAPWQTGEAIEPNRFGIPEPTTRTGLLEGAGLELVLVPLVGFDHRGNRLGFGGGYYDRTFAFLHQQPRPGLPLLVGIGYAFQELDAIEAQAWDVPLDYIATDAELIDCHPTTDTP